MRAIVYWSVLGLIFIAAAMIDELRMTNILHDVDALVLLFLLFLAIKRFFIRSHSLSTASGAILMASGIFLNGAFHYFPGFYPKFAKLAALTLFLLWLWFMSVYVREMFDQKDRERHFGHPIRSFAVGTWIAATSVCGTILDHHVPEMRDAAIGMAVINAALWLFYMGLCLRSFAKVFVKKLYTEVHGIVLLSTVSTQSLIIFYGAVFRSVDLHVFSEVFLIIGSAFYVLGFALILIRYFPYRDLNLKKNWTNTNCIMHGAMSITGLAGILSHGMPLWVVTFIWVWCLAWFIIVEIVEVFRAVERIKAYGANKGIGAYDVSQWARNFTFGMFFAFSMNIDLNGEPFLETIRGFILSYGSWVVLLLLLNEIALFFKGNSKRRVFKGEAVRGR